MVWSKHFGRIEGGEILSPSDLCSRCRAAFGEQAAAETPHVRLHDLPTLLEWEAEFHGLKRGKAPGADGISHDIIAGLGQNVPQGSYSLALKTAVTGAEPLRWRGGLVTALYKGKGSLSDVGAFRSTLVSEVLAKRYHSWVRKRLEPWLASVAHSMQQGPIGHHSTPEMSLMVRTVQMHMRERGVPLGCLFVDISAAFYSVLREFLLPAQADVGALLALCGKLGFSTDTTRDVISALASQDEPCLNQVWQRRVADVLSHTWFQVTGSTNCVATRRGSRPGDPLADLLFGIVMAQALTDIQKFFEAEGFSLQISRAGVLPDVRVADSAMPIAGAWQDDCVFFITASSCDLLVPRCRAAIRQIHAAFAVRGLELNYKPSKTELLLCPVGVGSRAVKSQIYRQPPFCVAVLPDHGPCLGIRVAPEYRHLGTAVEWSGSLAPAIEQAIEGAAALIKPLRKHVFGNRDAPLAVRVMLFRSLVLAKALYATGSWAGLTKGESLQWQAGITRLLRALVPYKEIREDPKISLFWLLRTLKLPAPSVMLRLERLRLLSQILGKDTIPLRQILESAAGSKRCWLTDVVSDLQWLRETASAAGWSFPLKADFTEDLEQAFLILQQQGRLFGSLVRRAWRHSGTHVSQGDIWHSERQQDEMKVCPVCQSSFKGMRGLRSHFALKHRIFPEVHSLLYTAELHTGLSGRPARIVVDTGSGDFWLKPEVAVEHYHGKTHVSVLPLTDNATGHALMQEYQIHYGLGTVIALPVVEEHICIEALCVKYLELMLAVKIMGVEQLSVFD
ncbi:GTPBP4, partial [Symbiodinium pilosum]